ncbi:MAG: glycosyltransferase family 4 protein, partial [Ferruginibacter sp.]
SINQCEAAGIRWHYVYKQAGKHIGFLLRLTKQIKKASPDIIFLHGSGAIPAAFLASLITAKKQQIIVRETQANHLKTKAEWMGLKLSLWLADKVVFLSEQYKNEIEKRRLFGYKASKIAVIPNGVNLDLFKPAHKVIALPVVLGMQSRLVAIKDHNTLITALYLLKQKYGPGKFVLQIAGDGIYKEKLLQSTKTLSLENDVYFLGLLKESDLPIFLQSCDIYIHASLGETMSTAIMQAMACKLPVIASDVDGINNMITNRYSGILVKPQQPELLADAINMVEQDAYLRQQIATNALKEAENNFSNIKMFLLYRSIFIS